MVDQFDCDVTRDTICQCDAARGRLTRARKQITACVEAKNQETPALTQNKRLDAGTVF